MKKKIMIVGLVSTLAMMIPFVLPLPAGEFFGPEDMAFTNSQFIDIDGYQAHVEIYFPDNDNDIVFLHGFGSLSRSWSQFTELFDELDGYRLIAIDLKGFGLSEKGYEFDYSHSSQAEYVLSILEVLNVERAFVVGHSMGGNVAIHLVGQKREIVSKMILISPAIQTSRSINFAFALDFPPLRRLGQFAILNSISEDFLRENLSSAYFDGSVSDDLLKDYQKPLKVKGWELSLLGIVRDSSKHRVSLDMIDQDVEILLLWGNEDTWVPVKQAKKLTEYFRNIELVVLDKVGHVAHEEAPERVYQELLSFINE